MLTVSPAVAGLTGVAIITLTGNLLKEEQSGHLNGPKEILNLQTGSLTTEGLTAIMRTTLTAEDR